MVIMRITLLACFLLVWGACNSPEIEQSQEIEGAALAEPAIAVGQFGNPVKLILDTDTANEIDDMYAIARLLPEKEINLLGITSAQWYHHLSGDSTVYRSQRLNEEMLAMANRLDLPHPMGSDMIMGMPWGGYEPRESAAAQFIIDQVRALPVGEKLVVMSIGATTNLASAIALAPEIAPKIAAYIMGFQFDPEKKVWDKDEFNVRRDLNAANFLLNQKDLELHVMSATASKAYTWQQKDTFRRLEACGDMGAYLKQKWLERFAENDTWVMWDVALVHAFLYPEMATEIVVTTPPENEQRRVWAYTDIDFEAMYADYWENMEFWN
jgi:purine nucleosidase